MFKLYENRLRIYIFTTLFIILLFLFSAVYFSFSTVLTDDYTQKSLHFSKQSATSTVSVFDRQEEMTEIWMNKYNIKEQIQNHTLALNSSMVKQFSLDMLGIGVFTADGSFYADSIDNADALKELFAESRITETAEQPDRLWRVSIPTENSPDRPEAFVYIRKMTDDADTLLGYLMVLISKDPFIKMLNVEKNNTFSGSSRVLIQFDGQSIELTGEIAAQEEPPDMQAGEYEIKNKTIIAANKIINQNGLLITYKPMEYLSRQIQLLRTVLIVIFIMMISIIYIALNSLIKKIIEPLNKLNHEIQNYAKQND